ncbi:MAG: AAA family ATPase [Nitrospirae bacterium]|nr:AAA family ATPase [Nitrospirota bacterium]
MISKIKRIKNIGKFYDYASKGDGLDWKKKTFLFAPNAYGKSTLVNVLRSLRDGNAKIISSRKTVNASGNAEAVIIAGGENHVFGGAKWDKSLPAVKIFDTSYIHDNILARDIEHEHKKNMHRIIIGEQGVKLAQELSAIKSKEKEKNKHIEDGLKKQFKAGEFTQTLESFRCIPATAEEGVAERIKKLGGDIKAKESEEAVKALGAPQALVAPAYDVDALKAILSEKVTSIHDEAEKLVLAQIEKNIKDKEQAKDFISTGLDLIQLDCPFCGQGLGGAAELIAAYRQYFDDSFRVYQEKVAQAAETFEKWNFENELTTLSLTNSANVATVKQWASFMEIKLLPDIPSVESLSTKLKELKTKIRSEIEKKQKDPNLDVDQSPLDELSELLRAQKNVIDEYNAGVVVFNGATKAFVANLPASGIDELKRNLSKEQEIEKRFKPEWKKWAEDYEKM